jgi:hypothetical protein
LSHQYAGENAATTPSTSSASGLSTAKYSAFSGFDVQSSSRVGSPWCCAWISFST